MKKGVGGVDGIDRVDGQCHRSFYRNVNCHCETLNRKAKPRWLAGQTRRDLRCSRRSLKLPHLQQCHQERQRGLRSLVFIGPVGMKTISTTAGGGVVQGGFQIVISQKPIERGPRLRAPLLISGRAIRLRDMQRRLHLPPSGC